MTSVTVSLYMPGASNVYTDQMHQPVASLETSVTMITLHYRNLQKAPTINCQKGSSAANDSTFDKVGECGKDAWRNVRCKSAAKVGTSASGDGMHTFKMAANLCTRAKQE